MVMVGGTEWGKYGVGIVRELFLREESPDTGKGDPDTEHSVCVWYVRRAACLRACVPACLPVLGTNAIAGVVIRMDGQFERKVPYCMVKLRCCEAGMQRHWQRSIIHHPSSIIHHPSSIIHHPPSSINAHDS